MKAIKSLLAVSVLVAAGAANAQIWDASMVGVLNVAAANGPVNVNYTGTWDDATNSGNLTGTIAITAFNITMTTAQVFNMDESTGLGSPGLAQATSCTDTGGGAACNGFVPVFKGRLYNGTAPDVNTAPTFAAFTPVDHGVYNWALRVSNSGTDANGDPVIVNTYTNFKTTLTSPVPVPAAAWLFGSGLLGLAGTARRRFAAVKSV